MNTKIQLLLSALKKANYTDIEVHDSKELYYTQGYGVEVSIMTDPDRNYLFQFADNHTKWTETASTLAGAITIMDKTCFDDSKYMGEYQS